MRRPCRRMRSAIEVDHPIHRAPPLNVVCREIARQRIDFFLKSRSADPAPLVSRRMRTALILGNSPNRFGGGLRALPACGIQWDTKIIAERRLTTIREAVFVILYGPFPSK